MSPPESAHAPPPAGITGVVREAPHLARMLRVLARHGVLGALRGERHWPPPAQVREALEELGVVFLKFGQVLAVRRDLLPAAYVAELELLHDRLPAMPAADVEAVIAGALGAPVAERFASFAAAPMAAATIAQVHEATLPDGRHVVVKVRRTGLDERIAEDTATLAYLAAMAQEFMPALRRLDPVGLVREFREGLRRETDLRREAETIGRFRAALADVDSVWVPNVVPERSAEAVLTLEFSPGERIDRYAERHPDRRRALAEGVATLLLHQVFETGLFHADPHPGNVFVLPDGRLCLHDFGLVGELDEPTREGLVALLAATVNGDARAATDAYLDLGLVGADVDRPALEADLGAVIRNVHERPLAEVSVGEALGSLFRAGSEHRVQNPGVLLLLARAFLLTEAVMRRLDPQMSVVELFRREVGRVASGRYAPSRLLAAGRAFGQDAERFLREAPADLRRTLRRVAEGDLGRVHAPGLEEVGRRASRDIERLTGAVAAAAFVIAGALLVPAGGWHRAVGDALLAIGILSTAAVAAGALLTRRR